MPLGSLPVELIFIRHGRPIRDDSSANPPLAEIGQQQAVRVSDFLQGEQIDHIIASTMTRAHQTAKPLAGALGMTIELRDDIREVDEHSGNYVPSEELEPDGEFLQQWKDDPFFMFADHGGWEPWKVRMTGAIDDIVANNGGKRVAVFCHGMVMATVHCLISGSERPFDYLVDYTGIARYKANSAGLRTVVSWNETQHVRDLLG